MTDIEREALCNEIDFLQKEVDKYLTFEAKGDCPWKNDFEAFVKNSVEDELSDIIIRCLDLAGLRGIDFDFANALLQAETDSITSPFPYYMYSLCSILTSPKADLDLKLNYCVYAIVCYCRQRGIGIGFFIKQKMQYNKLRPYKHGNKKY